MSSLQLLESMEKGVLEALGLTSNEARLYLLLLERGPSVAGQLIRKSGFQSSVVYHLLGRLQEKGVVSFIVEGGQKYYSGVDPAHFEQLLAQREQELLQLKQNFSEVLPQLQQKKKQTHKENVVQIYSGKHGLKTVFNDILQSADEYLVYGGTGNFTPLLPVYQQFFQQERIKRNIKQRSILFGAKSWRDGELEETKLLQEEQNLPFSFIVHGDTVLINLFDSNPVTSIKVESETLSQAFSNFFEEKWKRKE